MLLCVENARLDAILVSNQNLLTVNIIELVTIVIYSNCSTSYVTTYGIVLYNPISYDVILNVMVLFSIILNYILF